MSAPLIVQPRCPGCGFVLLDGTSERPVCAMACKVAKCPVSGCGQPFLVSAGCDCSRPCADCGEVCVPGEGCAHDERLCGSCYVLRCDECRQGAIDDMAAEIAWEGR